MPFVPNPNAFPSYPPPQYGGFPGANWLLKQWGDAMQRAPWLVQPGAQPIPHQFPQGPGAGGILTQPVADIYRFPPKTPGMLGATEGAGGRGLGSRGGGMLGSKWRDPGYIQQYETAQGLKPGSIKPPSAEVSTIAPQGPQRDFGKYNAKVTDPRMLTPEARREMQRDTAQRRAEMDIEAETARRIAARQVGPTSAQMARPVQMTPEIAAKLAGARSARAAFRNMQPDLWGKMSSADRKAWLKDAQWQTWPVEQQRTFMETFMPQGIGP